MALHFVMVGQKELVYERRLSEASAREDQAHVHQFVLHSALDLVEEKMWQTTSSALKVVDEFNDLQVHAWIAPNGARFLLLHESVADDSARRSRIEDNVRNFFEEINELYTKLVLNPFYALDQPITSEAFERRVATSASRWGL